MHSIKERTYQGYLVSQHFVVILQHFNYIFPGRLWKQRKAVLKGVFEEAITIIGRNHLQSEGIPRRKS